MHVPGLRSPTARQREVLALSDGLAMRTDAFAKENG